MQQFASARVGWCSRALALKDGVTGSDPSQGTTRAGHASQTLFPLSVALSSITTN